MNGEKEFKVFERIYKIPGRVKYTEVSIRCKTVTKQEQHRCKPSCGVTTSAHSHTSSS